MEVDNIPTEELIDVESVDSEIDIEITDDVEDDTLEEDGDVNVPSTEVDEMDPLDLGVTEALVVYADDCNAELDDPVTLVVTETLTLCEVDNELCVSVGEEIDDRLVVSTLDEGGELDVSIIV